MVFTASDRPEREMTASGASVRGRRFRAPKKRENLFFFLKKKLKNFLVKDPNGRQEEDEKREKEEGKKKKEVEEGTSHSPEATHAQVSLSPEGAETLWLVFFNLIF